MIPILIVVICTVLIGSVVTIGMVSEPERTTQQGSITSLADHFLTYTWAVGRYVGTRETAPGVPARDYTAPFAGNSIPDSELTFPAVYSPDNRWTNIVVDGWITVYTRDVISPAIRNDFNRELTIRSDGAHGVGVVDATREIVSLRHGRTGYFVPAAVPVNAIVFHYKSH